MSYFENIEISETYHVSLRTVLEWIDLAQQAKNSLKLYSRNNKKYIARTPDNITLLEHLRDAAVKEVPANLKSLEPKDDFYKIYSPEHVLDIVQSLDIYKEIPNQYSYFDIGAEYWDKYVQRLAQDDKPNSFKSGLRLLDANRTYIEYLCKDAEFVNIVDIGVGNAMPMRNLISRLKSQGKFGKYIGVDISPSMLRIAHDNLVEWFGNDIQFEAHIADMNHERFAWTLAQQYLKPHSAKTLNIVMIFGGTLNNMRSPDTALRTIRDSLGKKDVLVHSLKLDSVPSRKYFDFNVTAGKTEISLQDSFILDLLNIAPSYYEVEMIYDDANRQRQIRIKLKQAMRLKFKIESSEKYIEIDAGESLILWRYWHQNANEVSAQFTRTELTQLHTSVIEEGPHLLTISKVAN